MNKTALELIFDGFNRAGVLYLVVGGLAVVAHGYLRLTCDIDIVLNMNEENIKRALNVLATLDYIPRVPVPATDFAIQENRNVWMREKGMMVFSMISTKYEDTVVDLFAECPFDFDGEFNKAALFELNGIAVPVVCKNTLLAMKRKAGRPKDLLDIEYLTHE